MAATIEAAIWLALKHRVEALALVPALPVAWPNVSFEKPTTGYLRVTHLPNVSRRPFVGSDAPHWRMGLLQIDYFAEKNKDAAIAAQIAGQIVSHFPPDFRMTFETVNIYVNKVPDVAQAFADDTHWQTPITVNYRCFA